MVVREGWEMEDRRDEGGREEGRGRVVESKGGRGEGEGRW